MKGFTLIELIVSISLMMMMAVGVIAGYNRFTDVQRLRQAALDLKNNLRFIQGKAISGEKPYGAACDTLVGYSVNFTSEAYTYQADCNPPDPQVPLQTNNLPKTITFSPIPPEILFLVLNQGVNISSTTTLTLTNGQKNYRLQITPSGEISDLGIQ